MEVRRQPDHAMLLSVTLAASMSAGLAFQPEASPPRFSLGAVDLLALSSSSSLDKQLDTRIILPPSSPGVPTLAELHASVDALNASVKSAVQRARRQAATAGKSDVRGDDYGNSWGALAAVVLGSINYTIDPCARRARQCLAFLEGVEQRAYALHADVPETDEPAAPALLTRFDRIASELRDRLPCR